MKKLLLVSLLLTAGLAAAEDLPLDLNAPVEVKKTKPVRSERPQPCAMIERVCKGAGFKQYLHRDCVKPLLKGLPVKDANGNPVTTGDISLQQIKACKMYKEDNLKP
ncbi:MAG: hypothetical protein IT286_01575 [Proteobacteria bacterium]|jgi:hypothetical protein|nr:hypothetical protein [Pseudomonadota bacterium]